jgi:uncharacterized repeat protein (TIGR01451 family)
MRIKQLFTLALAAGISATSVAETKYGESILNTATLNFKVNNQKQVETSAAASFLVDRKVIVNVSTPTPGNLSTALVGEGQVITYTISNLSNAPLGMKFDVADLASGEITYTGLPSDNTINTPSGPAVSYAVFLDDGNGGYDNNDTTQILSTDTRVFKQKDDISDVVNPDSIVVHVVVTPTEGVDENVFAHDLVVTAVETNGSTLPNDNAAAWDPAVIQTIIKDDTDIIKGRGGISISSATLTPSKEATIVSDPINGTSDPKAVPGAIIKYEIKVVNSGSVAATDLVIEDTLPAEFDLQQDITDNITVFTIGGIVTAPGSIPGTDIVTDENKVTFPSLTVPANDEVIVTLTVKLL